MLLRIMLPSGTLCGDADLRTSLFAAGPSSEQAVFGAPEHLRKLVSREVRGAGCPTGKIHHNWSVVGTPKLFGALNRLVPVPKDR